MTSFWSWFNLVLDETVPDPETPECVGEWRRKGKKKVGLCYNIHQSTEKLSDGYNGWSEKINDRVNTNLQALN